MRGAHQAFFLDDDEKSMREAMGEILAAREAERAEREAKGEPASSRRTDPDHPQSLQQRYRLA